MLLHSIDRARAWVRTRRSRGETIALVPTMGALHEGHLTLVDTARRNADHVVVTIFVNPRQFAPGEDFDSYPRTLDDDYRMCQARGVGLVIAPDRAAIYPEGYQTSVQVERLGQGKLCAASRPHFFGGVATVVLKLLNIVQADVAVFGEKDYQQLQVIRRMCEDLHHPTRIVGSPLVREPDGLAMSSRNRYLSADQRQAATSIHAALQAMKAQVSAGAQDPDALVRQATGAIEQAGGRVDYVSVADAITLEPIALVQTPCRALVAAWFGEARLIDNMALDPPTAP